MFHVTVQTRQETVSKYSSISNKLVLLIDFLRMTVKMFSLKLLCETLSSFSHYFLEKKNHGFNRQCVLREHAFTLARLSIRLNHSTIHDENKTVCLLPQLYRRMADNDTMIEKQRKAIESHPPSILRSGYTGGIRGRI